MRKSATEFFIGLVRIQNVPPYPMKIKLVYLSELNAHIVLVIYRHFDRDPVI
jgi:hypothetical protein